MPARRERRSRDVLGPRALNRALLERQLLLRRRRLSAAEATRIIPEDRRASLFADGGGMLGTVLIDGFLRAQWKIPRDRGGGTLLVEPFVRLSKKDIAAVTEEGARLLRFAAGDADTHVIEVAPPGDR